MNPKISIITPNYNGATYLEETIQSVLNQGYSNLEYIIIDGGSTDGSVDIIKKYESQLAYWVSEPDAGLYHAIQKGFEKSTGDIMAWINSDDKYHANSFLTVAEIFNNFKQVDWIQGLPTHFDEKGRIVAALPFKRWCNADLLAGNYKWIQQESVFWRRELWNKAGGYINTDLKLAGDLDLWLRFFRHSLLYSIHAPLAGFRLRSSQQLSLDSLDEYDKEALFLISSELEKYGPDYKEKLDYVTQNREQKANKIDFFNSKKSRTKKCLKYYSDLFKYPDNVYFDRISQKFFMTDIEYG